MLTQDAYARPIARGGCSLQKWFESSATRRHPSIQISQELTNLGSSSPFYLANGSPVSLPEFVDFFCRKTANKKFGVWFGQSTRSEVRLEVSLCRLWPKGLQSKTNAVGEGGVKFVCVFAGGGGGASGFVFFFFFNRCPEKKERKQTRGYPQSNATPIWLGLLRSCSPWMKGTHTKATFLWRGGGPSHGGTQKPRQTQGRPIGRPDKQTYHTNKTSGKPKGSARQFGINAETLKPQICRNLSAFPYSPARLLGFPLTRTAQC